MGNILCLFTLLPLIVAFFVITSLQRKGKLTVRVLAFVMTIAIFLTALALWLNLPSESWLIGFGIMGGLGNGFIILMLPVIGRKFMQDFNIHW